MAFNPSTTTKCPACGIEKFNNADLLEHLKAKEVFVFSTGNGMTPPEYFLAFVIDQTVDILGAENGKGGHKVKGESRTYTQSQLLRTAERKKVSKSLTCRPSRPH